MPLYVYTCPECELDIEELRPMAQADAPMWCPICGSECGRGITRFAAIRGRGGALDIPAATPSGTPIHRMGCLCCAPPRPRTTPKETTS